MCEITKISELLNVFENSTPGRMVYFRGQVCDWSLAPALARDSVDQQGRSNESECFEMLAKTIPYVNLWEPAAVILHRIRSSYVAV